MNTKKLAVILGSAWLTSASLMAESLGIDFSGGGFTDVYCPGYSIGYTFQVTSPVTVIGLAAYDPNPGEFQMSQVGLWNNGGSITPFGSSPGSLITSATISADSLPTLGAGNLFAEVGITPITLQPGYYDVAAYGSVYTGGGGTFYSPMNDWSVAPGVNFVQDSFSYGAGSLSYPNYSDQYYYSRGFVGWFGGNIVFGSAVGDVRPQAVLDASSSLMLLSVACLALGMVRWKFVGV